MPWSDTTTIYFIALAEIACGLLINGFITVTKLVDLRARRKLKPFDKIFLSLGLSRLILLFFSLFNIINRTLSLNFYHISVLNWMLNTVYLFLDFSSLWLAMWLCVLYFIKVVIFKITLLVRIKLRIPELVKYMILSSLLVSLVSGFIFAYNFEETLDIMVPPESSTKNNVSVDKQMTYLVPSYVFGHFVPFALVSFSSLFLIEAIYVHVRRLTSNVTSYTTPSMDAHFTAIRSAIMLELMTVYNLIIAILLRFDFYDTFNKGVLFLLGLAYPMLHSVVLIAGNAKLRKDVYRTLHHVKECGTATKSCIKPQKKVQVETIIKKPTKT